jgi:hypothetical protein
MPSASRIAELAPFSRLEPEPIMQTITYKGIVARYGSAQAFDLLLIVERLAKIQDNIETLDEETRFQRALDALDQVKVAD